MANPQTAQTVNGLDISTLNDTISQLQNDPQLGKCTFRAENQWIDSAHNVSSVTDFHAAKQDIPHSRVFEFHADEPQMLAGKDQAANPVEHLITALAECVTTSLIAHAAVRGIHIDQLQSHIEGDIDLNGFLGLSPQTPKGYTDIRINFKVKTDTQDMEKLKQLASFSPVYNTILDGAFIDINIEKI